MLEAILIIFLVIVTVILLALLMPIRIIGCASGGTDAEFRGAGRVMFFAGLAGGGAEYADGNLRIGLYIGPKRVYEIDASRASTLTNRHPNKKKTKDKKAEHKKSKESANKSACQPDKPSLSEKICRLRLAVRKYSTYAGIAFREVRSLFRIDRIILRTMMGFTDPSKTGQAIGVLYALNGVLPAHVFIRPEWDFTREVFRGDADVRVTFRTWLFWIHLVRAIWSVERFRRKERAACGDTLTPQEA